jgi:predicted GTPase
MLKYYQPVVLFLISGDEGVTKTDRALMTHILDLHLPTLVVINKIDLLNNLQKEKLLKAVEEHF